MATTNSTNTTPNPELLKLTFKSDLEAAKRLIANTQPGDFKSLSLYFKALNDLKTQSQKNDPGDTLGWAVIIDEAVEDGFKILATEPPNGDSINILRRLADSAERAASSNKVKTEIKSYKDSINQISDIFASHQTYDDAASSGGSGGWGLWILIIVIFDILSLTFDFGFIIY